MIKLDKICFLQVLTVFGLRTSAAINRWGYKIKKKLVTKKVTTQKMKFCIKDFFSKFNQIHKKMWTLSYLLKEL